MSCYSLTAERDLIKSNISLKKKKKRILQKGKETFPNRDNKIGVWLTAKAENLVHVFGCKKIWREREMMGIIKTILKESLQLNLLIMVNVLFYILFFFD